MRKRLTTEEFISRAKNIHGDRYIYNDSIYVGCFEKITIICLIHGKFQQTAKDHFDGCGCPKCSGKNRKNIDFIEDAIKIHGNKFDYSKVEYINVKTKIKIICKEHGIFEQIPNNHLSGKGCNKCADNIKKTTKIFIETSKLIHNNNYNYELIEYCNNREHVKIICKIHGVFEQKPSNHLSGQGCFKCNSDSKRMTKYEFETKANIKHNNKFDYSISIYNGSVIKTEILCKKHGSFWQTPNAHLSGQGCPNCHNSKGENKIMNFLIKNNKEYICQKIFINCINKKVLPFDFYIPEDNLCIEYDGEQHFYHTTYFGGQEKLKITQHHDQIKTKFCEDNNIKLLRIPYWDLKNIDEILEKELNISSIKN